MTSKAKAKIRLALKETQKKDGLYAKELLERRFKNRKIEIDESLMARTIKKMGYKENSDFYKDVAEEKLDVNTVVEKYIEERDHDLNLNNATKPAESAENFAFENPTEELLKQSDDVLVIDEHLKGIDFELSHCCHPIYGDPIFGFQYSDVIIYNTLSGCQISKCRRIFQTRKITNCLIRLVLIHMVKLCKARTV